jgi:hypothetical protein
MSHSAVDNLLDAVRQLAPNELDDFAFRFADWQQDAADDGLLIQAASRRLSTTDDARLRTLIAKSEQGCLTDREQAEYRDLAQRAERLNVHRVRALAELARRRGKPLQVVMKEIGWEGDVHGVQSSHAGLETALPME